MYFLSSLNGGFGLCLSSLKSGFCNYAGPEKPVEHDTHSQYLSVSLICSFMPLF